MQACTQWTHFDLWSQCATTPDCLFTIGDRQSEKKWLNGDRRAICNATRGRDAGRGVIRHRDVSDGSAWARPLWRSYSARTEMFFADVISWYLLQLSLIMPCSSVCGKFRVIIGLVQLPYLVNIMEWYSITFGNALVAIFVVIWHIFPPVLLQ